MKKWEVTFWAGDTGPTPTKHLHNTRFHWKWTAEVYRWWLSYCPVWGLRVLAPINPVRKFTQLKK